MSKRVLITGSEGFTGRYVYEEFHRAGWDVWGAGLQAKPDDPQYFQIDLLRPETLKPITAVIKPDVVIHLAAMAFVHENNPAMFYQVNLIGTRHLLETLCNTDSPPDCTILASSANVYGNSDLEVLSENDPVNPANDYAVSKLAMEYLARTFMHRLKITITRPFNYTGVGQSEKFVLPKIVSHFLSREPVIELGNIDVARDFSDVRDIARHYFLLASHGHEVNLINFCSGSSVSLKDCLSICSSITGNEMSVKINPKFIRTDDVKKLCGSRERLESILPGTSPRPLSETLDWMLSGDGKAAV